MHEAFLGLGSNKGERISYLNSAVGRINLLENTRIVKMSSVYETQPWGNPDQNEYLNSVVKIETSLMPVDLMKELKDIESVLGRKPGRKWTEREIDIDLLFYGSEVHNSGSLKVPHSQIECRRFVLVPMNEIAPEFVHPVLNKSISELLNETKDKLGVFRIESEMSLK